MTLRASNDWGEAYTLTTARAAIREARAHLQALSVALDQRDAAGVAHWGSEAVPLAGEAYAQVAALLGVESA